MTLDEAIKHAEEVANEKENLAKTYETFKDFGNHKSSITSGHEKCLMCAEEHRQLAEWLKELKQLREQEPCEGDTIDKYYWKGFYNGIQMAKLRESKWQELYDSRWSD